MQLGYIGLGKMGKNMVLRLLDKGHRVTAWNRSSQPRAAVAQAGALAVETVEDLVETLPAPRVIWLMLPAGQVTQDMVERLIPLLDPNDLIIQGANSFYEDTIKMAKKLQKFNIKMLDCGVSGGPAGARHGACLMIGGNKLAYQAHEQLFADLAAKDAYQFFEGHGAGHFVKMVHNAIEYGMMQAIAEGFEIIRHSRFQLDLKQVARIYNRRSVIQSRLIGWTESGYQEFGANLEIVSGSAGSGGSVGMQKSEAKWTLDLAKDWGISTEVLEAAVQARLSSQKTPSYQGKVINMLRNQFGGHSVKKDSN